MLLLHNAEVNGVVLLEVRDALIDEAGDLILVAETDARSNNAVLRMPVHEKAAMPLNRRKNKWRLEH